MVGNGGRRARILVLAALVAGCGIELYGTSGMYDPRYPDPIEVVMPPGALHISQQFRPRTVTDDAGGHYGIDIWGPVRTPVLAAAPGRVIQSFYEPAYGNQIVVDHGRDEEGRRVQTVYVHLHQRLVDRGDTVARGEQIATMGATGVLGMMVHLHFEVRRSGDGRRFPAARDPHLFWVDGPGRVTCFDPDRRYPDTPFGTTYPTPCKDV